jgi:phosphoglycolate phosphatase
VWFAGRTDRSIARDLFHAHAIEDSERNWDRFRSAFQERLVVTLAACPGRVLPGVLDLLEQLSQRRDVALGLLTGNTRRGAQLKLDHYRLGHYFGEPHPIRGGFGDEHLDRDAVARHALEEMERYVGQSAHVDRVVVVGDTPLDVQCARAISARAVAVATGIHSRHELASAQPDLLVDSLADSSPLSAVLPGSASGSQRRVR